MNKNFEPVILETYAELCVRWRMAHVEDKVQAGDYDAQLKSLEGVIAAFKLSFPGAAPASPRAGNDKPAKAEAKALARSGSVILED